MTQDDLRFPIGPYEAPAEVSAAQVAAWIDEIERFPAELRAAVEPLTPAQLATPYRPGGWRVRQVVHHLADSHLNGFCRFKLAVTEDRPTIKPYREELWAELPESDDFPVAVSLQLIEALYARWVVLMRGLSADDLRRELVHPEIGVVRVDAYFGNYAWHSRHHLAHITRLVEREGW